MSHSVRCSPRPLCICVVGAGAAGICAARRAVEQLPGAEVSILEQSDRLGGTWVYVEENTAQNSGRQPTDQQHHHHSSMYAELRTNIPKEVMAFSDFPIESGDFPAYQNANDSFPRHEVVLSYLNRFAEPIKHLIRFNLRVSSIVPLEKDQSAELNGNCQETDNFATKWRIVCEETTGSQQKSVEYFDIVFVCTGHYWCPRIPNFANKLTIRWAHSHCFRRAETFAGMHVAVVGANLSGVEIAFQLAQHAAKVYLINPRANSVFGGIALPLPPNVLIELNESRVVDVGDDNSLVLSNGRVVGQLQFVLFCTGYRFNFPFFDQYTGSPVVWCDGNFVSPLIGHVAHPNFLHSLFFIGLNLKVDPFLCIDAQCHFALDLLTDRVPNASTRFTTGVAKQWEEERLKRMTVDRIPLKHFHQLGPDQWDYYEWLSSFSGRKLFPKVFEKIYKFNAEQRNKNALNYRNIRYQIVDEQNFTAGFQSE